MFFILRPENDFLYFSDVPEKSEMNHVMWRCLAAVWPEHVDSSVEPPLVPQVSPEPPPAVHP